MTSGDRFLMCAFNNRFRADAQFIKRVLEKRELGTIFYAKAGWLRQRTAIVLRFSQRYPALFALASRIAS